MVISVGQSTVAAISGLHCRALVARSVRHGDSLIAKFKEAGGTVREIDAGRVTAIISALVICIIVCLSWAVNHYRDNAITSPARQKCQRTELANAAITDMQIRQRDVAALDAKYEELVAEMDDALRDVAAGRRRLRHQSSLSVSA